MSQYKLIYKQLPMTQEVKYDEYDRPTHSILYATVNEIDIGINVSHKWDSPMSPEAAYKLVMEAYTIKLKKTDRGKICDKSQVYKKARPMRDITRQCIFLGRVGEDVELGTRSLY